MKIFRQNHIHIIFVMKATSVSLIISNNILYLYVANAAFIALLAADVGIGNAAAYKEWAMSQIHYMLGDNANDFSYVVGYGSSYPLKPHHRGR